MCMCVSLKLANLAIETLMKLLSTKLVDFLPFANSNYFSPLLEVDKVDNENEKSIIMFLDWL